jgi:hypothetical protein
VVVALGTDDGFPLGLAVRHGSAKVGNPPPDTDIRDIRDLGEE